MFVSIHKVMQNIRQRIDKHSLSSVSKTVRKHNFTYLSPTQSSYTKNPSIPLGHNPK